MTPTTKQIGRLALREEDHFWVAYYALPDTMEGALRLGSIAMVGVVGHSDRKETFLRLMREMVGDLIEERCGVRPTWPQPPQPAPESERKR